MRKEYLVSSISVAAIVAICAMLAFGNGEVRMFAWYILAFLLGIGTRNYFDKE